MLRPGVARCLLCTALMLLLTRATALAVQLDRLNPGHTYHVDQVVITGNHAFSQRELLSQMKTQTRPFYLFWKSRPTFDPDVFNEDLKRLQLFYRARGYFRAKVKYDLKVQKGDLITSDVKITENRPSKVERITIVVNRHDLPSVNPLYRQLKLKPGNIFADGPYQASQDAIRDFYRNEGYANVQTSRRAEANVSENAVRIWYFAQPGVKGVFGKTTIVGAQQVQPNIIRRELTYSPGQQFSQQMLDKSTERLLKLGLFSVVRLTPHLDKEEPRVVPIRLTVKERPRHSIDVGGGYNTQSQFIVNFAWHDMNWLGGGRQLTAYLRYSNIDSAARLTLTQPYLFNTRAFTGILSLGEDIQQVPPYTLFGTRFLPSITYFFTETTKAFIGYRLEYDKLSSVNYQLDAALGGIRMSGIVSGPQAGFTRDTTNDLFNPSRGYVLDLEGMQAGEIFGGNYDFYRFWGQIKHYHLIGWKTILATRFKLGTGDYFGTLAQLPPFLPLLCRRRG